MSITGQVALAGSRAEAINFELASFDGYKMAQLPAASKKGRVAWVTDTAESVWMDTGTSWTPLTADVINAFAEHRVSEEAFVRKFDWSARQKHSVNVKAFGAKGDGRTAIQCSMTSGAASLTCKDGRFIGSDVGKPIVVYEAGPMKNGFVQPLSSRIERYVSDTSVVLADSAQATVNPSSRVLWGTDDTSALQAAVEALADAIQINEHKRGILEIPAGIYLLHGIDLPCATPGKFAAGSCTTSYNNIWIRGAGREETLLENWDTETPAGFVGLIDLGKNAEVPTSEAGNDRLRNIKISDLSLRQIRHPTNNIHVIRSYATQDVEIFSTTGLGFSHECYIMGGGAKSVRWYVHHNVMGPCGNGGPSRGLSGAALNLNGEDWIASDNEISQSTQGVEMGSRRGILASNRIVGTGATGSPSIGVNVGSTGSGIWDNVIARNYIKDFAAGIQVVNTIGTVNRTFITENILTNTSVSIYSGQETNGVTEGDPDTVVHGMSIVSHNSFRYDRAFGTYPIQVGELSNPQGGLEDLLVSNNRVTFAKAYIDSQPAGRECSHREKRSEDMCRVPQGFIALSGPYGGGTRWRPSREYQMNALAVPNSENGYYYRSIKEGRSGEVEPLFPLKSGSLVTDGNIIWENAGKRPSVIAINNELKGPEGAKGSGRDIDIQNNGSRGAIKILNLVTNYEWRIQQNINESFDTSRDATYSATN